MKRAFIIIIMLCLFAYNLPAKGDITGDLILALSFEEDAGVNVKDMSGNENNGTVEGTPQWVDGHFGKAMYFDGKTYIVVPYIALDSRSFTIQLWTKPQMTTEQEVVFSQYDTNGTNLSLHCRIYNDGKLLLGFYSNDLEAPPASMKVDQWYNLTFRFDADDNSRTIFVDGQQIASDVSASAYLGAKGEIWIGGWERPSKPEHPFYQVYKGALDEVRLWLKPLNEDEIMESMDTKMSVEPMGKVATTWADVKG